MLPTNIGPSLEGLLDQYEIINGPETFGPNGTAIILAIWRKSRELGWMMDFTMTQTEMHFKTGIKSRETINTYRKMLVEAGVIRYTAPPRGKSKGDYGIILHFIKGKVVQEMDNLGDKKGKVVQEMDNLGDKKGKVVQEMDNLGDKKGKVVHLLDSLHGQTQKVVQIMDNSVDTVLKDTITTTPTTGLSKQEIMNGMIAILDAYCKLHKRLDLHVKPLEREAMGKMVAGGMPFPFTIRTMETLLDEKRIREGDNFKLPNSFLYFVDGINEAWKNSQDVVIPPAREATKPDSSSRRMTKQEQQIDEMDKLIEEEERRVGTY